MALVIAGERSGVGKTTVTLALLSYLAQQRCRVQPFKVGPDYIDPMFHSAIAGRPCRNLDPVLTSPAYVRSCFATHCQDADYALVEGVMGLFDGVTLPKEKHSAQASPGQTASTAQVARLLNIPVLLVLDCARLSGSVAAIAHGYRSFDPALAIAGVVLNRVGSDRHLELLQDALAPLGMPILGVLRRQDAITLPDRHLGLVPTDELDQLEEISARLAQLAATSFDWKRLFPLLKSPTVSWNSPFRIGSAKVPSNCQLRIAVARDRAFNFYYPDNLDLLQQLGAELVFWSPLADSVFPLVQGLYFGGGFPEVFARTLSENRAALSAVRRAVQAGMPTYAECGGLMYLCQEIVDFAGNAWPMVGILPTTAVMGKQLTLGYRQAVALHHTPLLPARARVWGHEFHRSRLTQSSPAPLWQLQGLSPGGLPTPEGWQAPWLHASYLHLHWGATGALPQRFVNHCQAYARTANA